ncbi:potassium channel family protein [Methanospirillum sp.]
MSWVNLLMNGDRKEIPAARWFSSSMFLIISLNVIDIIIKTIPNLPEEYFRTLTLINHVSVLLFIIEYLFRLWVSPLNSHYSSLAKAKIAYILTPLAIIDLFALIPYSIPIFFPHLGEYNRIFLLLQLFILLKLIRYSHSLQLFARVFRKKRHQIGMVVYLVIFLLIVSSFLMYYIEHAAQPDKFSSIPATMWWSVITLSTVGYGDMIPITPLGRVLGSIVALLGIGIFALPAGILASGFVEEFKSDTQQTIICPVCNHEFNFDGKNTSQIKKDHK